MRKTRKTILVTLLSVILIASVFAGCAGGGGGSQAPAAPGGTTATTPAAPAPSAPAGPVTLTAMFGNTANLAGREAVFAEMEKQIGIKIDYELRPGGAEGENILRTRFASGDMVDVIEFNSGSLLSSMNPAQNMIDITSQPFMNRIIESYIPTVSVDGVAYGIPIGSSNTGAWLYNRDIYAELGLSIPSTWDQLMDNCQKVKDAGYDAIIASFGNDWTSQLILLADYYNVNAGDSDFWWKFNQNEDKYHTNPHAFKAFEHMQEVWEKQFFNADYTATTFDQALEKLYTGEGAHYPMLTHAVSNIATNYGVDAANAIGAFGQPGADANNHGLTVWMPGAYYFYKDGSDVDAMMRFAEFYLSEAMVELYSENQAADGPFMVKGAELPEDALHAIKDLQHYFDSGKTFPALEFITSVKGPNSPQICIEVYGGHVDALTGAKAYDDDVEKQAKQLGLPGW